MSTASENLTEQMRCLAASLAALLTQSGASLDGPWLGPLPPPIFAQILQHLFHGPMTLRARVQAASRLARVCKAWEPAVDAAAFAFLQFDVQDRAVLAHFDPKHGSRRTALQHVQAVKLEKADSSAALLASIAAPLLRDLPIRVPDVGGTARRLTSSLTPEQVTPIASVLAKCANLEYLDADMVAATLLPALSAATRKLETIWPRLRAIHMTWTEDMDSLTAVLQKISKLDTLESVKLSFYPPVASSDGLRGDPSKARARIQALPRLKEFTVNASGKVEGLWDAAAKLIPAHAKLAKVRCHGYVPANLCETLAQRCKSISTLELSDLRAKTELGEGLMPQLARLGGTPVRMLKIDVEPFSLSLGVSEPMPPASQLLDKIPATIHVVDATCASSGQPASFAYDDRLAAILARPVSHALAVADNGDFVPVPSEQPPRQIVAMHTDGPRPFLKFFVRFVKSPSGFVVSEWSLANLPDLAGL